MSIEYENLCLSSALRNKPALDECVSLLKPDDFMSSDARALFTAMVQCYTKGLPVEYGELRKICGITAEDYVSLQSLPSLPSNISSYIKYVRESRMRRELALRLENMLKNVEKADLDSISSDMMNMSVELSAKGNTHEANPDELYREGVYVSGDTGHVIKTGLSAIDGPLPGILDDQFVIVAARPSLGKTALALQIARHMAILKPVAFYSLEMSRDRLRDRMCSQITQIDSMDIITRSLSEENVKALNNALEQLRTKYRKLIIVDNFKPTIDDILTDIYAKANKYDLGAVFIDYMQLVNNPGNKGTRNDKVSEISCLLKNAAKQLHVPIIALSQLNRAGAGRPDSTPVLSDLRDSGAIEQDADVVIFIHKEEKTEFGVPTHNIIIAKNRDMISDIMTETIFSGPTFTFR